MKRWAVLLYGAACYAVFLGVFLYLAGFLMNAVVPKSMDSGAAMPVGQALLIDLGLVLLFGVQHTVMARPTFKQAWTKIVPKPIERSTYVMATNLVLIALFAFWQPVDLIVWNVQSSAARMLMYGLCATGFLIVLVTTFLIDHFDLFGMRQVWLYFRGKPYTPIAFRQPGVYKLIRHPLYIGWILSFWATPTMSIVHLAFAAGMTAYILIAIYFEERNLAEAHGADYENYRRNVPMFIPRLTKSDSREAVPSQVEQV